MKKILIIITIICYVGGFILGCSLYISEMNNAAEVSRLFYFFAFPIGIIERGFLYSFLFGIIPISLLIIDDIRNKKK